MNDHSRFASPLTRVQLVRTAAAATCTAALLLAAADADAQRNRRRQAQPQFSDATTVTVVEVPVQVISSGAPVRDLTRDDFELLDGRRPVEITGFDLVDLSLVEGKPTQKQIPVAARRHFLLFFDLYFTAPDSVGRAQQAAADLVLTSLHPTDLVAVAVFDTRPRLVLGFTSDRSQLRQAIRSLGQVQVGETVVRDPLGLVISDIGAALAAGDEVAGATQTAGGIDAGAMLAETRRELQNLQEQAERGNEASRIAAMTQGMSALSDWMASVEGRKHVVFLSEGMPTRVLYGNQGLTDEDRASLLADSEAVIQGRTQEVDQQSTFGDSSAQSAMERMLRQFREANCTIQAVDVSGQIAGEAGSRRGSLLQMAKDTGGEMFSNFTNLGDAMEEMLERNSVTYLLAFQPGNLKQDGKFRRLRVRLKDAPRGTQVVHRPGYYPPRTYEQTSPFERALGSAQAVMGGVETGDIDAAVLATGFPADSGKAYAPVLITARGEDLLAGVEGSVLPIEIYAYALDEDGVVRDFFSTRMGLDLAQAGAAIRQSGIKYWGHFDLDPGTYSARVLLRNDITGRRALVTGVLEVPGDGTVLQPPLFPEPPTKWLLLREDPSEQRQDVAFPFLLDGAPFIPASRPEVARGGEAQISLVAMNLAAGAVSVRAQVFGPDGEEVTQGGEVALDQSQASGGALSRLNGKFVAGKKLDPGDYTLTVTVTDSANGQHSSSTPIRVL
ncbi:MAG: VWA domain-containing protein [Holophagales bacterium]|nr:VWA domain-containing protein [Holophagales bacterium]MYG30247.1 VWA domain-containing protein [Holophagales bacterium]MYI81011.1 VWA domain-containing protein [Holophagales bacterium]